MTRDEVEAILASVLELEWDVLETPSSSDWNSISVKFGCKFSDEFIFFIELMSKYSFPGDIYNVSTGKNNGNDSIAFVYDYEIKAGKWNKDFIPFYGIGNGDYFCLSAKESPNSKVYYYYHDDARVEKYSDSFEEWIKKLPDFLR